MTINIININKTNPKNSFNNCYFYRSMAVTLNLIHINKTNPKNSFNNSISIGV